MARPKIKDARRAQILDAFEICVAKFGIEGATLAKTAEQAGVARPLVRHNVGNREELIEALVDRFLERSRDKMQDFVEALPADDKARNAVEWLFDAKYADTQLVQVAYALITFSADNAEMADKMRAWVAEFADVLTRLIADDRPQADPATVSAVAHGIMGIYFNVESLSVLGDANTLAAPSQQAALMLLKTLDSGT